MNTLKLKLAGLYVASAACAGTILHGAVHIICGWLGIQCPL